MQSIRRSALSLVRCLTVVSLLLSVVPPSTYTQAAPVRAPVPVQANTPQPTPTATGTAPATPTTFASPLAPAGPTPQTVETPTPSEEPMSAASPLAALPLLTMSAEPDSVAPGEVVTFSLALLNQTSAPMSGLVLSATLPPTGGLNWIPGQAGWTFDAPSGRLTADVGQLVPGQGVTLTAQLRAASCEGSELSQGSGCSATLEVEARSGDTALDKGSALVWVAQPARATIEPKGGKLQSADGRVTVEFPAGALSQTAEVTYRAKRIKPLTPSRKRASAIQFDLDALSESAQRVSRFAQPFTLTVSLKGLVDLKQLPDGMRPYLAYSTSDRPGEWIEVTPISVDYEQGTLSAQLNHFTGFQGGVTPGTPGVWAFAYNRPEVSSFSGASTYRIPLQVPAGRNGLQPDLALSYNSARVNARAGRDDTYDRGPVGDAWSIDVMDISRERWYPCHWNWNGGTASGKCFKDVFVLLMNGTGYELDPVSTQTYGRYYAVNAPWLYIERKNDNSGSGAPNRTGEYWIVRLPNGSQARLGYNGYAEQVTNNVCNPTSGHCRQDWNDQPNDIDYGGRVGGEAARRWRVDTMTDTVGNTMTFNYTERTYNGNEIRSTLRHIYYNYVNSSPLTHIYFPGWDPGSSDPENAHPRIERVEIYNANSSVPERQYLINQITNSLGNMQCSPGEYISWNYTTLGSLQEKNGDASLALPAQSFGYSWYESADCHGLQRLTGVNNGYGGTTNFSYQGTGRPGNVRVSRVIHNGGVAGSSPITTTYTYGTACYDEWLDTSTPSPCISRPTVLTDPTSELPSPPLVGHDHVREIQWGPSGGVLGDTLHHFYIDPAWRVGREYRVQRFDSSGVYVPIKMLADFEGGVDSRGSVYAQGGTTINGPYYAWTPPQSDNINYWDVIGDHDGVDDYADYDLTFAPQDWTIYDTLRVKFSTGCAAGTTCTNRKIRVYIHDADGTGNSDGNGYHYLGDWTDADRAGDGTIDLNFKAAYNRDQIDKVKFRVLESFFGGVSTAGTGQRTHLYSIELGQKGELKREETTWGRTWIGPASFAYLAQNSATDYDQGKSVGTSKSYTYDSYGNVIAEYDYGAEIPVFNAGFEAGTDGWGEWSGRDVGAVGTYVGGWSLLNGVYTVRGGGADIWGTADAFYYMYRPLEGDGEIVARVDSLEYTNASAKAGVMIRATLATTSTYAGVFVTPEPANGIVFQGRTSAGGSAVNLGSPVTGLTAPYWVKLVRSGSSFTGYRSSDGNTWTSMGTASLTMGTNVYIGLAVTAHSTNSTCAARFSSVTLNRASASGSGAFIGQSGLQLQVPGNLFQDISGLVPGASYQGRAWVKAAGGTTASFRLCLHDGTGGNQACGAWMTPSGWTQASVSYTANATGKARISLQYSSSGSGAIYVDEVALAPAGGVGDERTTHRVYAVNASPSVWIVNKPGREKVCEGLDRDVSGCAGKTETRYYYDGNVTYGVMGTRGLLTQEDRGPDNFGQWAQTQYQYSDPGYPGNLTRVTDPLAHPTTIAYDTQYHIYPTTITNAKTQTTTYEYYGVAGVAADNGLPGQLKKVTDPNGAVTEYRYDAFGRLTRIKAPDDPGWNDDQVSTRYVYRYDGVVGRQSVVTHRGRQVGGLTVYWEEMYYDGLGRTLQVHKRENSDNTQEVRVTTTYDARGQAQKATVPYTGTHGEDGGYGTNGYVAPAGSVPGTTTQYDALGRVSQVTAPDGTTTRMFYRGRQTAVIDANSHQKISTADAYGRLITVQEYDGTYASVNWTATPYATTQYAYNTLDNLTDVWDAANNQTHMNYDPLGRKTSMSDPDMGAWSYGYDLAGNLTTQTDAKSQALWFKYDEINRLTEKRLTNSSGTLLASYGYDAYDGVSQFGRGRRTSMSDLTGSTSWTYDRHGRVTQESKTINGAGTFNTSYAYDPMDRVTSMTYPSGEVVTQTYNAASQLSQVRSPANNLNYASGVTYNALGQIKRIQYGNGQETRYNYFGLDTYGQWGNQFYGRLFQTCVIASSDPNCPNNAASNAKLNLSYWYDNVGNMTAQRDRTNDNQIQWYTYDALDRLVRGYTDASQGGGADQGRYDESYQYNAIGNITSKGSAGYGYNDAAHKHAATAAGSNSYAYDANGNMIRRAENSTTYAQGWDAENRLAWVDTNTSTSTFIDAFDSLNTSAWAFSGHQSLDGGTLKNTGVGDACQWCANFYRLVFINGGAQGQGIQVEFKVDSTDTAAHFMLEADSTPYRRFGVVATGGKLVVQQVTTGNEWGAIADVLSPLEVNVWYVLSLKVTTSGTGNIEVWRKDDPSKRGSYAVQMPAGPNYKFHHWIYRGTAWLDNYQEANLQATTFVYDGDGRRVKKADATGTTVYGGNHYEQFTPVQPGQGAPLALHLKLDEAAGATTFADSSGNNRTGSCSGAGCPTLGVIGKVGAAAQLNGSNVISVPVDVSESAYAATLWFKTSALSVGLFSVAAGNLGQNGHDRHIYLSNGNVCARVWNDETICSSGVNYADGQWHHVAHTFGGAVGGQKLYVDGTQRASGSKANSDFNWQDRVYIGFSNDAASQYFNGTLDEVRIYNGALSAAEVQALARAGQVWRSYHYAGSTRIAMRVEGDPDLAENGVYYLHGDHLGSASLTTDASGNPTSQLRYLPYGAPRPGYPTGTVPTDYRFTGQRSEEATLGSLYDFGARFYSPVLGRFISADTLVPGAGNPQALNRYSYVYNNPLRFADPSGHWPGPVDRLIGRAKEAVLQGLVVAVPAGAEVMYQGYSAASSFIAVHPNVQAAGAAVNDAIDAAKPAAGSVINSQDTNTMTWGDLFGTWALEQGHYSEKNPIRFGPDAALTKELMHHEGVNDARAKAMEMIAQGRTGPVGTESWGFGPADAFPTVLNGNALQFVLGSYYPGVTVVGNDDGSYTMQFQVKNTSGWESATRYRNGPPGQPNLGVFDDRQRGKYGLHLGGNLWEEFSWTETVWPQ